MDTATLLPTAIILVLGIILQSAAGFGYGMFIIPLLVLFGAESYEAVTIAIVTGSVQTAIGAFLLRRHVDWKQVAWMVVIAAITIPLGVMVLERLNAMSPAIIRRVFGAIIFVAVLVQWIGRFRPCERLHPGWGAAALTLSGFMSGLAGMGGPPVVIWVMAHTWSNERSRATLWAFFTAITPIQFIFLFRSFGAPTLDAALLGYSLLPIMLLGVPPGLWIGHHLSKPRLRALSFLILLCISVYAMVQPGAGPAQHDEEEGAIQLELGP